MQTIESVLATHTWPRAFGSLHCLVRAAGLEYILDGYKPATLFAPDDEAFNQLHQGAVYDLIKDIDLLRSLLEYHIVPLKLTRATLIHLASSPVPAAVNMPGHSRQEQEQVVELPTLSNHILLFKRSNDFRVQGAKMLAPELETDNAVVHPLEHVLWPPHLRRDACLLRPPSPIDRMHATSS